MVCVPAKTSVEAPGSTVPAVDVQLWVVRSVPPSVSVPPGLLITTAGRSPAAVVEAPVNVWAPPPLISSVAVPVVNAEAWVMGPWAATVPVLKVPPVRLRVPPTESVVPAAIVVVPRTSTALRVWLPVTVPPTRTSVDAPGSTVPAVYVQLFCVRSVPAIVSVPLGLLMTTSGNAPAAVVEAPVNVWAPAPAMARVAVPPA